MEGESHHIVRIIRKARPVSKSYQTCLVAEDLQKGDIAEIDYQKIPYYFSKGRK